MDKPAYSRPNVLRDGRLDLELLSRLSTAPPVYEPGEPLFWTDPHISSGMLEAHLDPNTDAASRRPETILKTVKWLSQYLRLPPGARVIDLGCGPGLYCTHFRGEGWKVTGLDFSERSIAYAREQAAKCGRDIEYVQLSYLDWDESDKYDAAFIIYCDLGALKDPDRDVFLQNVFRALKPGGRFVFDVETPAHFADSVGGGQNSYWGATPRGFWKPEPHLLLSKTFYYPDKDTYLDQHIVVVESGEAFIYRVLHHAYTRQTIVPVLERAGFIVDDVWGDLTGSPYSEDGHTLAVAARKPGDSLLGLRGAYKGQDDLTSALLKERRSNRGREERKE